VDEDLKERIRLAAQRAVAASSAADPAPPKPVVSKTATPKTAAPNSMIAKIAGTKKTQASPPRARKTVEPKIFVPPRAPDDPGPEPTDGDGVETGPLRPAKA
jgi:hypothetical protein